MRVQREKLQSGRKGDKRWVWGGSAALAEGARLNSGGIQAGGVRGESRSVVSRRSRDAAGGSSRSESCQEF